MADWAALASPRQLHALALAAYDHMIGLDVHDIAIGGANTIRARVTIPYAAEGRQPRACTAGRSSGSRKIA